MLILVACFILYFLKLSGTIGFWRYIFRIQACDLIICGYFCIRFNDFLFKGKSLTVFTNSYSPHNFEKKDKVILDYF